MPAPHSAIFVEGAANSRDDPHNIITDYPHAAYGCQLVPNQRGDWPFLVISIFLMGTRKNPIVVSNVTQKHNTKELHNYHSRYDIHAGTHTYTFVANGFKMNGSCGIRSSCHSSKSVLKS